MKTEHKAPEMSGIFKELAENFISADSATIMI